uniref:F-box associated beta-propeller type 1 domain-containing protein n=1 Tax=Arabidopsis halleri TaxID=81970 RepID=K4FQM6_ARAHA|nr:hypothetical protein 11M19.4 [Arabidopsis halleri]
MVIRICDLKACSMSVNLHNHEDLVDPSIKQIGYDSTNNHKILTFHTSFVHFEYKFYDFKSCSWRHLGVDIDCKIYRRGVNLRGNTYFIAQERLGVEEFLLCFDFTSERFGPRLPLPFHSCPEDYVILSTVREEKLAVLFKKYDTYEMGIWITTKIKPNLVSWRNFFKVDMRPLTGRLWYRYGSFFVEENKKVAMICDIGGKTTWTNDKAYMVGENGYYREVDIRESKSWRLMCSYVPSLVQIQTKKLVVLFTKCDTNEMKIWITTKIEPNIVLWSNFLKVDMRLLTERFWFPYWIFFVDEKKKVAMICHIDSKTWNNYKSHMVGENGYYREVECRKPESYLHMCSYVPSSVQIHGTNLEDKDKWERRFCASPTKANTEKSERRSSSCGAPTLHQVT